MIFFGLLQGRVYNIQGGQTTKSNFIFCNCRHATSLKSLKDIHAFNNMAQFYHCCIQDFVFIMAPITKLQKKN